MNNFAFNRNKEYLFVNKLKPEFFTDYFEQREQIIDDSTESLALSRFRRSIISKFLNDTILETVIGMEMMLVSGKGDLSLQFRLNTSWLLGRSFNDRKIIERLCNSLYRLRSIIVHEGGKRKSITDRFEKTTGLDFDDDSVRLLYIGLYRLVLLRSLFYKDTRMRFLKHEKLKKIIQKIILGDKIGIKPLPVFDINYTDFMELINNLYESKSFRDKKNENCKYSFSII